MGKALTKEEIALQSYFVRGYKTLGSKILLNQDLKKIYELTASLDSDTYYGEYCSKLEDVVHHAKQFFLKHYSLHAVPHISADKVNELHDEAAILANGADIEKVFDFQDRLEEEMQRIDPFDLPLQIVNYDTNFNGGLVIELMGVPHSDFLTDTFVVFPDINIDSDIGDLSVAVYAHELTHSQIESAKKVCSNYQNSEVISIFNEKLCALELDPTGNLLKEIEKRRLKALSKNIHTLMYAEEQDPLTIFTASYYITSTLKATHLFDKYLKGSPTVKEKIISGIQKVFDSEATVESLLNDNNITLENSCNVELVKKHI